MLRRSAAELRLAKGKPLRPNVPSGAKRTNLYLLISNLDYANGLVLTPGGSGLVAAARSTTAQPKKRKALKSAFIPKSKRIALKPQFVFDDEGENDDKAEGDDDDDEGDNNDYEDEHNDGIKIEDKNGESETEEEVQETGAIIALKNVQTEEKTKETEPTMAQEDVQTRDTSEPKGAKNDEDEQ